MSCHELDQCAVEDGVHVVDQDLHAVTLDEVRPLATQLDERGLVDAETGEQLLDVLGVLAQADEVRCDRAFAEAAEVGRP